MKIAGHCVLLSGASGGIGGATAMALARKGASVILSGRDLQALDALKRRIDSSGGCSWIVPCDLSEEGGPGRLAAEAIQRGGRIDVLISCAGVLNFGVCSEESAIDVQKLFTTNVVAPIQLINALLPHMIVRGAGRIVTVGSMFGSVGFACFASYSASQFALRGYSESLRRELVGTGVGVTYVAPRYTHTPFNSRAVARLAEALKINQDSPEAVAAHIINAIERECAEYCIGWQEALLARLNCVLPRAADVVLRRRVPEMRRFAFKEAQWDPRY